MGSHSLVPTMNRLALPDPAEMSASARAHEITTMLAAAIVRCVVVDEPKQRADSSHKGLGFLANQRVHTTPYQQEKL